MKKLKEVLPFVIIIVFVLTFVSLLVKISIGDLTDAMKHVRAIGYPKDTIQRPDGGALLVVEMHDFVKDTIYLDTIPWNIRKPSTLEDFEPKYRRRR